MRLKNNTEKSRTKCIIGEQKEKKNESRHAARQGGEHAGGVSISEAYHCYYLRMGRKFTMKSNNVSVEVDSFKHDALSN